MPSIPSIPSIPFYNELTNFSGTGISGGSGYEDDDEVNATSLVYILIPLSPLLLVVVAFVIICFSNLYYELVKKCKSYMWKYEVWNSSKNEPIFNGKLSAKYITTLNTKNHSKIDKKEQLDCSICIEPIHLEKFKLKKNDLVFLECGHVYHKDCLQSWVKSQIKNIDKPNCPMCRKMIVDYCKKDYINYDSDSSYGSEWD